MRVRAAPLVALLAVLASTTPAQAATAKSPTCKPHQAAKGTVIVIQGGGFVWPGWGDLSVCRTLAAHGFYAINLVYPLRDLPGAVRVARGAARRAHHRGGPVFAFGLSSGGTLAELLAVTGRVDGAVAVAAPTDLLHWAPTGPVAGREWRNGSAYWRDVGATRAERRAASPVYHVGTRSAPLLLFHSRRDEVVPLEQARLLRRRDPNARLRLLRGRHLQSQAFRAPALVWLTRRARAVRAEPVAPGACFRRRSPAGSCAPSASRLSGSGGSRRR